MKKGVFWLIDGEILAFPYDGKYPEGTAKSGDTYNHRKLWEHLRPKGGGIPFDYYPRGRVEIDNKGRAVIYSSPHISNENLSKIAEFFELENYSVRYDHSEHYKCVYDRDDKQ